MPRFFIEPNVLSQGYIIGEDARHIARSLRMKPGDPLCLCDGVGTDFSTRITAITPDTVHFSVVDAHPCPAEPDLRITLFQGYPKSDKFESIIQKSVELGVSEIVPVLTERCVARPDPKNTQKKRARYEKISLEAAKQSGRGKIPIIGDFTPFSHVCDVCGQFDAFFLLYEAGGQPFSALIPEKLDTAALLIGPEGGFAPHEAEAIQTAGGKAVTLGKRILRTETAPIAALSILTYATGNME